MKTEDNTLRIQTTTALLLTFCLVLAGPDPWWSSNFSQSSKCMS